MLDDLINKDNRLETPKESPAIKLAHGSEFQADSNTQAFFEKHYSILMNESELVKRIREAIQSQTQMQWFYFVTDSSSFDAGHYIVDKCLDKVVEGYGCSGYEEGLLRSGLFDLYVNSLTHGNKAKREIHAEDRKITHQLKPEEMEENKGRKVEVGMVFFGDTLIYQIADQGEGYDLEPAVQQSVDVKKNMKTYGKGFILAIENPYFDSKYFHTITGASSMTTLLSYRKNPGVEDKV